MTVGKRVMYYEDFAVGDTYVTPSRTVGEYDISQFAGLSGDYNPIHTDATFAEASEFGQRIAHGLLGMSILTGLVVRLGIFEGSTIALLGVEQWRFKGPIFAGDTVHVVLTIKETRLTSDGTRGVLIREYQLVNQRGEVVQQGIMPLLVKRAPIESEKKD